MGSGGAAPEGTQSPDRQHAVGQSGEHGGIVVQDAGSRERQPELGGEASSLDVEVVEHLEVVGDESLRTHQHSGGTTSRGEVVQHVENVGAAPGLGRGAG